MVFSQKTIIILLQDLQRQYFGVDFDIRSAYTANGVVLTAFVKGQTFKFYPDDTEYTKRITYKELKNLLSNV